MVFVAVVVSTVVTAYLAPYWPQRLHALAVTTGLEKFGGPVAIREISFGVISVWSRV